MVSNLRKGKPVKEGSQRAWLQVAGRYLLRHPATGIAGSYLAAIVLLALFAPYVVAVSPTALDIMARLQPPSAGHLFGTDNLGRDLFAQVLYGARLSLTVGACTAVVSSILGALFALCAGFYPKLDATIMRVMDGLMALPGVILAIAIMAAIGPQLSNILIALAIVYTPRTARLARSAVLVVREQPYIEAARALGGQDLRIIFRHILPGIMPPVLVQGTYVFATAMLLEAALSFLGVGAPPNTPSWGIVLAEGRLYMRQAPWLTLIPGIALSLTVLAVNLVGDSLRDGLDPKMRS